MDWIKPKEDFQNTNFVVRYRVGIDRVAVGNLKAYTEGMYIQEDQIDDLIAALQEYKKLNG